MRSENIKKKREKREDTAKQATQERSIPSRIEKDAGIAPNKLELLVTVVDRKKAEYYADLIQSFDVNMQVATLARGTADVTDMLEYFGVTDSDKTVIFSFVGADKTNELMDTLEEKFRSIKGGKGISVAVPFSSVIGKLVYGFLSNDGRII